MIRRKAIERLAELGALAGVDHPGAVRRLGAGRQQHHGGISARPLRVLAQRRRGAEVLRLHRKRKVEHASRAAGGTDLRQRIAETCEEIRRHEVAVRGAAVSRKRVAGVAQQALQPRRGGEGLRVGLEEFAERRWRVNAIDLGGERVGLLPQPRISRVSPRTHARSRRRTRSGVPWIFTRSRWKAGSRSAIAAAMFRTFCADAASAPCGRSRTPIRNAGKR